MSNFERKWRQVFIKAIGHPLQRAVASVHGFEGRISNEPPLCLWLYFEGLSVIRLYGASDGEQLRVDHARPVAIDMGKYGELLLRDASKIPVVQQVLGNPLKGVWLVKSLPNDRIIGVRLDFGLAIKPIILNWGDELYVGEEFPIDAEGEKFSEVALLH